ncbi:hypothetical protein AK973_5800 [Pseudomonas brassicacearum]|nr:hypothetical protein AK973_5800 [Pseudomonas brassicacearum]
MYANGRRCAFSVRAGSPRTNNAPSEPDRSSLLQRPSDRWRERSKGWTEVKRWRL